MHNSVSLLTLRIVVQQEVSSCGSPPERRAPRRLVSVLRHDDAPAGYPRSGQYRRRDGRSTPAIGGGCTRWRLAEFRRSLAICCLTADDLETLLRPVGRDFPGTTVAPLGKKPGETDHSDSKGLLERHWIACLLAGCDR